MAIVLVAHALVHILRKFGVENASCRPVENSVAATPRAATVRERSHSNLVALRSFTVAARGWPACSSNSVAYRAVRERLLRTSLSRERVHATNPEPSPCP